MASTNTCPKCGAALAGDALGGLCPTCVAHRMLATDDTLLSEAGSVATLKIRYFGDYELLEEVARGGMGVVYKARQVSLNRIVAVKMILAGQLASEAEVKRFRAEAEAAANLRHPNIVTIHEVGEHQGLHYFSMDYVEGKNLAQLVRDNPLPPKLAARYVKVIAEAIHYAHERGTLHRDLKPSNVLLEHNNQPRITDFGLAKRTKVDSDLTVSGQVLGSPNFMPPEQAAGKTHEVSPCSDVYGLGAMLYHLLTARPPFVAETIHETLTLVLHAEPASPRLLNPNLPRDVETVCLKCLEKSPARRYASALELAEDLGRFLNHEPIRARPASPLARAVKWARRKPTLTALLAIACVGVAGIVWEWRQVESARAVAVARAAAETKAKESAEYEFYVSQVALATRQVDRGALARAAEALESCPRRLRHWEWDWLARECQSGPRTSELHRGAVQQVAFSPDGGRVLTLAELEVRLWDWEHNRQMPLERSTRGRFTYRKSVAFDPSGKQAIIFDQSGCSVWDGYTGQHLRRHDDSVLFSELKRVVTDSGIGGEPILTPEGRRRFTTRRDPAPTADLWDIESGRLLASFRGHTNEIRVVAFSPDGRRVLTADGNVAEIWDAATGRGWTRLEGHLNRIECAAFSPDGSRVVTGSADQSARLWDLQPSPRTLRLTNAPALTRAAFSANSRQLVAFDQQIKVTFDQHISRPRQLRLWDTHTGQLFGGLELTNLFGAAISRDGARLVTIDMEKTAEGWWRRQHVHIWGIPGLRLERTLTADRGMILAEGTKILGLEDSRMASLMARSSGGRQSNDYVVIRIWDTANGSLQSTMGFTNKLPWWTSDGRHLLSPFGVLAAETGEVIGTIGKSIGGSFWGVYVLRGARRAVVFPMNLRTVSLIDLRTGRMSPVAIGRTLADKPKQAEAETEPLMSAFMDTEDGRHLLLKDRADTLWVLDTEGEGRAVELIGHASEITSAALFPDGRRVLTGSDDHTAKIWDTDTGRELLSLPHAGRVTAVAVAPDGQRIFTAAAGGPATIWACTLAGSSPIRDSLTDWHRQEAEASEKEQNWFAARFHLERLLKAAPSDSQVRGRYEAACSAYTNQLNTAAARSEFTGRIPPHDPEARPNLIDLTNTAAGRSEFTGRIPPRDPEARPNLIDLTDYYTAPLVGTWHPHRPDDKQANDLAALPAGVHRLAGAVFDVRGVIQLSGAFLRREDRVYPEAVKGIPVGQKCQRLHFLHAAGWASTLQAGTNNTKREVLTVPFGIILGRYVVHYADGDQHEVPMVHGRDVREWWHWSESVADPKTLVVAWTGTNAANRATRSSIRLFKSTWTNPHPIKEISRIDFVSAMEKPAPFLIAITAE